MKIVVAILILSVIIIIHELGHVLLAKMNGVCVTEFSIGLGPRLVSAKFGETRYSIKLLPFGGSCMMLGEDEENDDERAFGKKNVWARISIIAAGPLFNFMLAFLVALFVVGMAGYDPAIITTVKNNSAASKAGLQAGDLITSIDGHKIDVSREYLVHFEFNPMTEAGVSIGYERDGKNYTTVVYPEYKDEFLPIIKELLPHQVPKESKSIKILPNKRELYFGGNKNIYTSTIQVKRDLLDKQR